MRIEVKSECSDTDERSFLSCFLRNIIKENSFDIMIDWKWSWSDYGVINWTYSMEQWMFGREICFEILERCRSSWEFRDIFQRGWETMHLEWMYNDRSAPFFWRRTSAPYFFDFRRTFSIFKVPGKVRRSLGCRREFMRVTERWRKVFF